jgi:hypothetical protein
VTRRPHFGLASRPPAEIAIRDRQAHDDCTTNFSPWPAGRQRDVYLSLGTPAGSIHFPLVVRFWPRINAESTAPTHDPKFGSLTLLADYVVFLVLWGAIGVAALVSGVVAVWSVSRRMNRTASTSAGDLERDEALVV